MKVNYLFEVFMDNNTINNPMHPRRQGDVLVRRIESLPEGLVEANESPSRIVLQFGEVTGHAHAIHNTKGATALLEAGERTSLVKGMEGGRKGFIKVTEQSSLTHEEHGTIPLEPGFYEVTRQKEYAPEESRWVND
jgi:hypothetical protein